MNYIAKLPHRPVWLAATLSRAFIAVFVLIAIPVAGLAQQTTSSIRGEVRTATGGSVEGAFLQDGAVLSRPVGRHALRCELPRVEADQLGHEFGNLHSLSPSAPVILLECYRERCPRASDVHTPWI